MATVDQIKDRLIEKILSINNKDVLEAIDRLISTTCSESGVVELNEAQIKMLDMSEEDVRNGRLISQDAMIERNLELLKGM